MQRILFANFHNKGYGQPTAVFLLARALHERGHDVVVASPPGSVLEQRSHHAGITTFSQAHFLRLKHFFHGERHPRAAPPPTQQSP